MDLPSQPPSSEETKQQHIHSSEEAPIQPSPDADSLTEETQPQSANPVTEETPTPSAPVADSLSEEIQPLHADPIIEGIPEQPASTSEPLTEETEPQITSLDQDKTEPQITSLDQDKTEPQITSLDQDEEEEDEDEDLEDEEETRSGVFIGRGLLIAIGCAVVIVALMATLLVVVTRPKDPPTDWIASYTPPATAGTPAGGKILYYLHWTNQNGSLKGQLQLATVTNGALQSATATTVGLYSKDNHIIYVVITLSGQASTLAGTINDNNDTLTLDAPGTTTPGNGLIFHTGSANDYKLAAKNLGAKK
jgi:hypothetical protein